MTSRIRSRHSRSPRGPNDIQYQLAQFPCGTHNPFERERVWRDTQPEDIDFEDHMIACKETVTVIPEKWKSAHQRTNMARQAHPVRECLLTKDPRQSGATTDLTTAQMFIQGSPTKDSPKKLITKATRINWILSQHRRQTISWYHSRLSRCSHSHSRLEPQKDLNYYQSRQYCLMPCHLCVEEQDGITYHCRQCVRPRLPEQREGCLRLHHQCLCDKHLSTSVDHHLESIHHEEHLRDDLT